MEAKITTPEVNSDHPTSPSRVIRVLTIIHGLGYGGAEKWLLEMMRFLRGPRGPHDITIEMDFLLTGGKEEPLDGEMKSLGCHLIYLPFTRRNLLNFTLQYRKLLKTRSYHVIHNHQDFVAGIHFALGYGQLPSIRIAHSHNQTGFIRNYATSMLRKATYRLGRELMRRMANHLVGTSKKLLSDYGYDEERFRQINAGPLYCGIDIASFPIDHKHSRSKVREEFHWEMDCPVILFVGRIDSDDNPSPNQKNARFALNIAMELLRKHQDHRFLFVGDHSRSRNLIRDVVTAPFTSGRIVFTGVRGDVPHLMAASDLLLFPCSPEGLGVVAVEAQASALPVLSSEHLPNEAIVIERLVTRLHLSQGPVAWAEEATRQLTMTKTDLTSARDIITNSPFSIQNSAAKLLELYTSTQEKP